MSAFVECRTQAEADAAAARGDIIVWRAGHLVLRGSSRAYLHESSSATLHESSRAYLHESSSATLYDSSRADLYGSSRATDGATSAPLRRDRPRLILGPLGSRGDTLGVSLPSDGSEPIVYAGCWSGRLSAFAARVDEVYPTGRHGDEYRATIAYIRAISAIPQEAT